MTYVIKHTAGPTHNDNANRRRRALIVFVVRGTQGQQSIWHTVLLLIQQHYIERNETPWFYYNFITGKI